MRDTSETLFDRTGGCCEQRLSRSHKHIHAQWGGSYDYIPTKASNINILNHNAKERNDSFNKANSVRKKAYRGKVLWWRVEITELSLSI